MNAIDQKLAALRTQPFRAKFHLGPKENEVIAKKGLAGVRSDAAELLRTRLFPAAPHRDGKQTPYRGHPVFVAQHATATCCRTCLMRWHQIPKGTEVTPEQQAYILDVIEAWIKRDTD